MALSKKDVVPFAAMAAVESSTVGLNTLFKAASLKGLGDFAFVTYSHALGFLLLLPFTTFIFRRSERPSLNLSVLCMIVFYGVIGATARLFLFKGVAYSSPALSSALGTLSPAFTFLLAMIFRMEYVDFRSSSAQAKIIGTIVSVSGALVAVLYKGPVIIASAPSHISLHQPIKSTSQPNWVLGGILIALEKLLSSSSFILLKQILQIYPAKLIVVVIYLLVVALLASPLCYITENSSAWNLRPDITLVAVLYSGFLGPSFIQCIHAFCVQLKGPLYISIFKPFSIVIASATGLIFLGEALHLGSVVGAVILLLGFYAVLWGKAKEEKVKDCESDELLGALPNGNTPLLQSIEYSSPALASAIGTLTPAFTFVLAVIFRMEIVDLGSSRTRAKIVGTITSISGAFIVIFYKGPKILSPPSQPQSLSLETLETSQVNWVVGGLLLVGLCLLTSIWYILQTHIITIYPSELTVVVQYAFWTAVVAAAVGSIAESNLGAWRLRPDITLISVLLSGCFGPAFSSVVHTWGVRLKGPVYVAIFRPFSIAIAAVAGVIFLGDDLYVGSVIGATILLLGFYAVIWGKSKEFESDYNLEANLEASLDESKKLLPRNQQS